MLRLPGHVSAAVLGFGGGGDAEGPAQNRTQTGVKRETISGRGQNGSRKQVRALQGCRGDPVTWRIGGPTLNKGLGVGWADPGDRHSPAVSRPLKDLWKVAPG